MVKKKVSNKKVPVSGGMNKNLVIGVVVVLLLVGVFLYFDSQKKVGISPPPPVGGGDGGGGGGDGDGDKGFCPRIEKNNRYYRTSGCIDKNNNDKPYSIGRLCQNYDEEPGECKIVKKFGNICYCITPN